MRLSFFDFFIRLASSDPIPITSRVISESFNSRIHFIKRLIPFGLLTCPIYNNRSELLFIFVLINGELVLFAQNFLNFSLFLCAVYLGLGCYVLGYYIWQNSQKTLKSSKVASFLYIEPFLTLLFSLLLQRSETIVLWNITGGIIVLIAVLIINYEK